MQNRQVRLLKYLMRESAHITSQVLSQQMGVSTKTIYHDINQVNEWLQQHVQAAWVEKTPRKGIRLNAEDKVRLDLLEQLRRIEQQQRILQYSPQYRKQQLIQLLFIQCCAVVVVDFAELMYVTDVTIRRDVDELCEQMVPYKVKLVIHLGVIQVEGQERDCRKFMTTYLSQHCPLDAPILETQGKLNIFFAEKHVVQCQQAIQQLSKRHGHRFTNYYFALLWIECLVAQSRFESGHQITMTERGLVREIHHFEVYFFAGELLEGVLQQSLASLPAFEIEAMAYVLLALGFRVQHSSYEQELTEQVTQWIQRISQLLNLSLLEDSHLQEMLVNHMSAMIFRLQNQLHIHNPALEEIKKQYSTLFHIVWLSSRQLSECFGIVIPDAELAFLTIHFQIAIEKISRPLTILVVCPNGLATSELIFNKLYRILGHSDYIIKIELDELTHHDLSTVDFIVSSVKLPKLSLPVIEVSPVITEYELQTIRQLYAKMSTGNHHLVRTAFESVRYNVAVFQELLNGSVQTQQVMSNQSECLAHLIKQANPLNLKSTAFEASIYFRESLGSTGVYTGIALPHCDPKFVEHSELVVMTLANPIEWGANLVKLVVLIAIAERDIELFKDALIAFYAKIEDEHWIEALCEIESGEVLRVRMLDEVSQSVIG